MKTLTVGGCRIPVSLDIKANLAEIKKAIDWAADNSVDIMCTPECALSGYMWQPTSQEDPKVIEISAAIDELKVSVGAVSIDRFDFGAYDNLALICAESIVFD